MRRKIQRSMILVISVTLLISLLLLTFVVYRQSVGMMEDEAEQEAGYVCAAIETSGAEYFDRMDRLPEGTRLTWIGEDGDVLYDSAEGQAGMENHADRPEVKKAFRSGEGQDIRRSDTLDREMFYYARRLSDGSVLRVSKTISSALGSAMKILPGMVAIAVLMMAFAWGILFMCFGRNFTAVMLTVGGIGFSMGATANGLANMQALSEKYGQSPQAWLIVSIVGAFLIDLINALIITSMAQMPL